MRFLLSLLLLSTFVLPIFSQEIVDTAQFRASYLFSYKTNSEQSDFAKKDLMYLDIGKNSSKFYSRYEHIRDSIHAAGLNANLSTFEINDIKRGYNRGSSRVYYQFMLDNKFIVTDRFVFMFALYEEQIEIPQWTILADTSEVLGYKCQKAVASFKGREWSAYFTKEIPLFSGPWKLSGLPGLIVKAYDDKQFFNFELQGFESLIPHVPIQFIHTNYDKKEYLKQSKETFHKMEKLYHEDVKEFMRIYLGAQTLTITRPDGSQRTEKISTPYIPLEVW